MGMLDGLRRLAEGLDQKKLEGMRYIQRASGGGYAAQRREEKIDATLGNARMKADAAALGVLDKAPLVVRQAAMDIAYPIKPSHEEERYIELDEPQDYERTGRGMQRSVK